MPRQWLCSLTDRLRCLGMWQKRKGFQRCGEHPAHEGMSGMPCSWMACMVGTQSSLPASARGFLHLLNDWSCGHLPQPLLPVTQNDLRPMVSTAVCAFLEAQGSSKVAHMVSNLPEILPCPDLAAQKKNKKEEITVFLLRSPAWQSCSGYFLKRSSLLTAEEIVFLLRCWPGFASAVSWGRAWCPLEATWATAALPQDLAQTSLGLWFCPGWGVMTHNVFYKMLWGIW